MSNLIIRLANDSDAEELQSICKSCFYDTFTGTCTADDMENYLTKTFPLERIQQEINDADCMLYLLVDDSKIVGYAKLGHQVLPELSNFRTIELERLYIKKEYFGIGAGNMLMKKCLEQALEEKVEYIFLGVWEHNYRAQKFYSNYGFEVFGQHPFPIETTPQTDLWMKKKMN